MSAAPLVSIIVPTYNRARLLPLAVESALRQTYRALEVVVVDDGSVDETPAVVEALYRGDARVRYYRQVNRGVSAARNRALAEARGSFIAFLDSDDVWQPWKLDLQMQLFAAQPQLVMCWTDMEAIDGAGQPVHPTYLRRMYSAYERLPAGHPFATTAAIGDLLPEAPAALRTARCGLGDIHSRMLFGNLVHTSTVVLRREVAQRIGGFDETMRRGGEDFKFHLATCRHGAVALLDAAAIQYRIGEEDRITHPRNNLHFARSFVRTLRDEFAQYGGRIDLTPAEVRSLRAEAHQWLAEAEAESGSRAVAVRHAVQAMWCSRTVGGHWRPVVKSLLPAGLIAWLRRQRLSSAAGRRPQVAR